MSKQDVFSKRAEGLRAIFSRICEYESEIFYERAISALDETASKLQLVLNDAEMAEDEFDETMKRAQRVLDLIYDTYRMSLEQLRDHGRMGDTFLHRQLTAALLQNYAFVSQGKVGRLLNRSGRAINRMIGLHKQAIQEDLVYKDQYNHLLKILKTNELNEE